MIFLLIGLTSGYFVGVLSVITLPTENTFTIHTKQTKEASIPLNQPDTSTHPNDSTQPDTPKNSLIAAIETLNNTVIDLDDDPTIGSHQAPITIIEFSDYQCEYCKEYFENTFQEIEEKYINTGKVLYVFRDFPLLSHPQAILASTTANCAGEQDKYWEMHKLLFENQKEWINTSKSKLILRNLASRTNLDLKEFDKCIERDDHKQEISNDASEGASYGITVTPTLFINNKKIIVGAQDSSVYTEIIEQELKKAEETSR